MKSTTTLLGIALVALLVTSGLAAAAGGAGLGVQASDGERTADGQDTDPVAEAQPAADGHNNPWVTGDDRLERFQERFGLTDPQMEQLRTQVRATIEDGADHDAIRAQVRTMLQEYGVDDPKLGPIDGQGPGVGTSGDGPRGHGTGQMDRAAHQGSHGTGPNGAADGSCTN